MTSLLDAPESDLKNPQTEPKVTANDYGVPMTSSIALDQNTAQSKNEFKNPWDELHERARLFMYEHGFEYDGNFPETGEGQQEKFNGEPERKDRRSWLKCSYPEGHNGTPGICITFGRFDGGSTRFTKTFWANECEWKGLASHERAEVQKRRKEQAKRAKEKAAAEKRIADELANKALNRWAEAQKANRKPPKEADTYFSKKGLGVPFDVHTLAWQLEINYSEEEPKERWIALIALRDAKGTVRAIQELHPDSTKLNGRDKHFIGKVGGVFARFGDLGESADDGKEILVAEGVATALRLFKCSNRTSIAALNCGNLEKVVKDLRQRHPKAIITICADNDHHREIEGKGNPGLDKAREVAALYKCKLAYPVFQEGHEFDDEGRARTDFDDLAHVLGNGELIKQIEEAKFVDTSASGSDRNSQDMDALTEIMRSLHRNEVGDAELFVSNFKGKYIWDPSEGRSGAWLRCSNGYWALDQKKERYKDFDGIADRYEKALDAVDDKQVCDALIKRVRALRTAKRRSAVLETASSYMALSSTEDGTVRWDQIQGKLPCKGGLVIDLKTLQTKPAEPEDYIKTFCPTVWKPDADCPLFKQFLVDVTLGDQDIVAFLQRLIGYISLGEPMEEIIVILYGPEGRNGKGTLCQILEYVLGPIARTFKAEMLLLQSSTRNAASASPDKAMLEGCRFAIFSEINKGRKIDPSEVKNLSGRDTISCRRLFSNIDLAIRPSHTMVLQTNFLPRAPADDSALWARTVVVPFNAHFTKNPDPDNPNHKLADESLKERLKSESQGILKWIVEGAAIYAEQGLNIPEQVLLATGEYRRDSDAIAKFFDECCEIESAFSCRASEVREAIQRYADESGMDRPTKSDITSYLQQRFNKGRDGRGEFWRGFRILQDDAS